MKGGVGLFNKYSTVERDSLVRAVVKLRTLSSFAARVKDIDYVIATKAEPWQSLVNSGVPAQSERA